jgi:hypothetical protein
VTGRAPAQTVVTEAVRAPGDATRPKRTASHPLKTRRGKPVARARSAVAVTAGQEFSFERTQAATAQPPSRPTTSTSAETAVAGEFGFEAPAR